jgi:hypothetical protein
MGIWESAFMKTTLDIPDDLFRQIKAKAASDGRKLKDVVEEALRLALDPPAQKSRKRPLKFPLLRSRRKTPLDVPEDAAARAQLAEDLKRHEVPLRQ